MTNSSDRPFFFAPGSIVRVFLLFALCLLVGFPAQIRAQSIDVSLPTDSLVMGVDTVHIPINVSDLTGYEFNSFQFTVSFDSTVISISEVSPTGYIADGFLIILNEANAGRIDVAAAGGFALSGQGTLLTLTAVFQAEGSSDLVFEDFKFEPGQPTINLTNGRLRNISLASNDHPEAGPSGGFRLRGNYPNPFSSTTRLVMDLPEPAQVRVQVFNVNGQLVRSYPQTAFQAGPNQPITLDASSLSAGSYLYRIETGAPGSTQFATGTMTIIH